MLGKIEKIINNEIHLKLSIDLNTTQNLINLYVLIQDNAASYIGEIVNIENNTAIINIVGEYQNNHLINGFVKKPAFSAKVDLISPAYISTLISSELSNQTISLGDFPFYENVKINGNINALFGSHLAIFGATGSGKSCAFARIIQNLFNKDNISTKMNLVIFDAYGEYHRAFNYLNESHKYAFKSYSSNINDDNETICIPTWFLDIDDYALLLGAQNHAQVTVIEKTLRNVNLFKRPEEEVIKYKNSIIANAILDILLSGRPAAQIRDQILSALAKFNTRDLNLESTISQPGYNRTFRQCLLIDDNNKINAIELITDFLQKFLTDEVCSELPNGSFPFSLEDFSDALDFALIDEGIWKSEKIFDDANILRVRLNGLLNSDNRKYFEFPTFISKKNYIEQLFTTAQGKKAQIINISIDTLDDRFAKNIVKIYSKLFYTYAKTLENRGSIPFNLFLEEAHRYVQNDSDNDIIGYNIFERIAKEGRKYGVLLGLISQRPCELSETCLSQCNNFLLFKVTHPNDINYVLKVVPNITPETIEKIKVVKPGYCISFGTALNIPTLIKFSMPNPAPNSDNCQISSIWFE